MDQNEQLEYLGMAAAIGRLTIALKQVEVERDALRKQLEARDDDSDSAAARHSAG